MSVIPIFEVEETKVLLYGQNRLEVSVRYF